MAHANKSETRNHRLLALLTVALLGVGVNACGGASKDASAGADAGRASATTAASRSSVVRLPIDGDGDNDNPTKSRYDDDDASALQVGRAPDVAEAAAIAELVKRYYTAGAAGDGGAACSLIYSSVAETVVENYGRLPGQPQLHGNTCAEVMSKLFEQHRAELAEKRAKLEVVHMRVNGERGVVLLRSSSGAPERRVLIQREGRTWKMGLLLDVAMP